ncbi:RNA polymerase subunit sigma-70 [Maricaulis sp. W15]|uniref:sigma-70 family RNA polymerase sigma factor n=1 Tax=Maricaulis sp. W15 TaxID=1772333 RepID=UPI000948F53C|nr:sigma-70 family RNA polymerase sigma factor [Maricaulis sp. W15]OLF77858.1 RNA polymerase subunit sigma-70 [Maricaulis sp. W15]
MSHDSPTVPDDEFKQLLQDAIPQMRAFSRGLARDPAAADDLAQEGMLRAWAKRGQFRAGTNFRAWALTIIRNLFYSEKRRSWRQVALDEEKAKRTLPSALDLDVLMELDEVRRALTQLSDDQREALMLVGAGGYSYEEAAEICGCAVGTVKSRTNRARRNLVEILEQGPDRKSGSDKVGAGDAAEALVADVGAMGAALRARG